MHLFSGQISETFLCDSDPSIQHCQRWRILTQSQCLQLHAKWTRGKHICILFGWMFVLFLFYLYSLMFWDVTLWYIALSCLLWVTIWVGTLLDAARSHTHTDTSILMPIVATQIVGKLKTTAEVAHIITMGSGINHRHVSFK